MNPRSALLAFALLAGGLLAAAPPAPSASPTVGLRILTVPAPARGGMIEVSLWYPPAGPGKPALIGDNAIFQGIAVARDAPFAGGPLPLILLSHGGMRAAPNMAPGSPRLATSGYLVAMPGLPDPRSFRAIDAPPEIWLRPADLSAALTVLENDPVLAGRIDPRRVGALGFFLGGTAALALAGRGAGCADLRPQLRAGRDRAGLRLVCQAGRRPPRRRRRPARGLASRRAHRGCRPRRSRAWRKLHGGGLAGISIPLAIIDLGAPDAAPPGFNAGGPAGAVPSAHYDRLSDVTAFSAFGECKPKAAAILQGEGEDEALCEDGGARSRAEIHAQLAAMIEAAFRSGSQGGL